MTGNVIPETLIQQLKTVWRVVVLTGAGISAESGIPTFREAQTGLWSRYHPTELATLEAFKQNPKLVWEWYNWRRELVQQAEPNPGHLALVQMAALVPHFTLITQNVDNLHQRAGSQSVIELHGSLTRVKCVKDKNHAVKNEFSIKQELPRCSQCHELLRPDVVWFGEDLPKEALDQAITATRQCDLVFSIGTSSLVYPAANLPFQALDHGATLVEINPNSTPLTPHAHFALYGSAAQILPALVSLTWPNHFKN